MKATATLPLPAASPATTSIFARFAPHVVRVLLGLMFFVFGLNGFLNFIPPPPDQPMPEFAVALFNTGYMFPLIKGTEVLVGVLLLTNLLVPLALVVLAPIVVNIVAFHVFLAPSGLGMSLVIVVLHGFLAWTYRAAYRPLLVVRTAPLSR